MFFTIENKASRSTSTMVIIGEYFTMIYVADYIPFIVALIIFSIIFMLSVIILFHCLCLIDYMFVMLGLQVFNTIGCVVLGVPTVFAPFQFDYINIIWTFIYCIRLKYFTNIIEMCCMNSSKIFRQPFFGKKLGFLLHLSSFFRKISSVVIGRLSVVSTRIFFVAFSRPISAP